MHTYEKLLSVGVTKVTEKWHDLLIIELILEGDFKDEDIAEILYQNMPVMFWCVGETEYVITDVYGMKHKYGFTRGTNGQV